MTSIRFTYSRQGLRKKSFTLRRSETTALINLYYKLIVIILAFDFTVK